MGDRDLRTVPLVERDCVYMIENRLRLLSSAPFREHPSERYPGIQTKDICALLVRNAQRGSQETLSIQQIAG